MEETHQRMLTGFPNVEAAIQSARASGRPFFRSDVATDTVEFRTGEGETQKLTSAEFHQYIRRRYSDATLVTRDNAHGWQAEYTSADGQAYLWYPGNRTVVQGTWRTRVREQPIRNVGLARTVEICFAYAGASNPVTGSGPDQEECSQAGLMLTGGMIKVERRPGDAFQLADGTIPYVLDAQSKPAWPAEATQ